MTNSEGTRLPDFISAKRGGTFERLRVRHQTEQTFNIIINNFKVYACLFFFFFFFRRNKVSLILSWIFSCVTRIIKIDT